MEELIKQGAEGRLYVAEYKGEKCLIKERFAKKYRHPDLDAQITRQRIKAETKATTRCQNAGILSPKIYHTDLVERKIYMEYFDKALTAKQYIYQLVQEKNNSSETFLKSLCERLGNIVGKMHANNIIHGDLTTSNILINPKTDNNFDNYDVILIDFGLSCYSEGVEDKGVDLYVLERALSSTHSEQPYLFDNILNAYRQACKNEEAILSKLEEVRSRGRKRTMLG